MKINDTEMKKVKFIKKWTLEITYYEDGTSNMTRTNDGFNPLELLGLTTHLQHDVVEQIKGSIKPDSITRTVIQTES